MKTFYYNEELLNKIKTVTEPTVFALDIGKGKTQTVYEYIQTNFDKKILIIVNNITQLDEIKELFKENVGVWHSKLQLEFEDALENSIVAITKNKFFQLLLHEEYEILNSYDEYFYDEFSGLSPIIATELINDLGTLVNHLRMNNHHEGITYTIRVSKFITSLIEELNSRLYNNNEVYKIELPATIRDEAALLIDTYWKFRKDLDIQLPKLDTHIIIVLKATANNEFYMSKFQSKNGSVQHALVVKNDILRKFIENKKFIVLDATALLNEKDYYYLGVMVDSNFKENKSDYSNLEIHSHLYSNTIKKHEIRKGNIDKLDQIVQNIPKEARILHTFAPKNAIDPLVSSFGFQPERLYYFFSGDDIGTNNLRDITYLNVVCTQTYPRILRIVYNHILYGYTLEEANRPEYDVAEYHMITRDLIQLIGRTAIRKHLNDRVIINLHHVDREYVQLMKEVHFKDCKIEYHTNTTDHKRAKYLILLDLIEARLRKNEREQVYIEDLLNIHYKSKGSMHNFIKKYKDQIIKIGMKQNYIYTKVRGKFPFFKQEVGHSNKKAIGSVKMENNLIEELKKAIPIPEVKPRIIEKDPNQLSLFDVPPKSEKVKIVKESENIYITNIQNLQQFESVISNTFIEISKKSSTTNIKTSEFMKKYSISRYKLKKYISETSLDISIKGHYIYINI